MIKWTKEQKALRDAVFEISEKLNEKKLQDDHGEIFSPMKWKLLCEIDLCGIVTDEKFNGSGLDLLTTMYLLEALGFSCEDAGLNFSLCTHIVSTQIPIQRYGSEENKAKYLPQLAAGSLIGAHAITEPDAGSDAFSMNTSAEKKDGHYVLNGTKTFITNGPIADLFIVYAWTDKNLGTLGGLSAFIVEKDTTGFTRGNPIEKMGLTSSPLCELFFDDCKIPKSNLLWKEGKGFAIFSYVMNWEVLCCSAIHLGEMRCLIEKCIEYTKHRRQFGQVISKFQTISHKIADMKIGLKAATAVTYDAGNRFAQGERCNMDIAVAKVLTSENYVKTSLEAIQIFGAYGYMKEYGIERSLRDAVAAKIYSGSSEIQRNKIAALMGI